MLFTPGNDFNWSVDNFGATYTDAGFGLNSPGHANANTKGANTSMLVGLAEDCYGIAICFSGRNVSTIIHRVMVDLLIDPAAGVGNAGTSWSVAIANLYANSPAMTASSVGYWYYFPLFLAKGTAIGTAHQSLVAGTLALRVGIRVYGKPSRPELVKVGSRVQTIGATVATTIGVTVTPGTNAIGSYSTSLGTLDRDAWWWQVGIGSADTTMVANGYLFDVAANVTNKILCMSGVPYIVATATEQASKFAFGMLAPYKVISSGQDVYVRGTTTFASPDSSMTAIVYALGG